MTRNQMVTALIDRANALIGNGNGDDEITANEAAGVVQDAISDRQTDEAEAAFGGNGSDDPGVNGDTPDDEVDEDRVYITDASPTERQKYEPLDSEAEASFGQKLLLQRLVVYADSETGEFKLLYPEGSTKRAIVDGKWNAGLAFSAIASMLAYERWTHPEGYSLLPNEVAVDKFHTAADAAA